MCAAAEARGGIVRAGGCSMGRCSALTRRYAGVNDELVNRGPARRCVWPVLAPAGGIARAGAVFVLLRSCGSIGMFYVRLMPVVRFYWDVLCSFAPIIRSYRDVLCSITPAVCRIAPNRTACDMFRSYSAVGRDRHSCVLNGRAVIGLGGFISGLCVSLWRSRRRTKGRGNGVGGAAWARFA